MEIRHALEVLRDLAEGVDPVTGRPFPQHSPYIHPDITRALFTCIQDIRYRRGSAVTLRDNRATAPVIKGPYYLNRPWTPEQSRQLRDAFLSGLSVEALALCFSRCPPMVRSELQRQGLVPGDDRGAPVTDR
ncbi:hypothetical protein SAMN05877962_1249 [Alloalcanivorax xenomutans]|uniref:hypothetical protein n=1 Tax=Alloalcanivorax xenomutans TaxID=1094342 RepID=UPI000BC7A644|nr:hypothetical protein [Alloalcanivorax xenomutans]MCE7522395.1 hypothetical protein [Alloalcanivorax xenomutans]SOC25454.1 hypothetical protein SAMN05877962_1249 [Alloalcanivorax xenomutans]